MICLIVFGKGVFGGHKLSNQVATRGGIINAEMNASL